MKYLDEMTKEELVSCAKKEKIFLGLTFNREKKMKVLKKPPKIVKKKFH